MNQSELVILVVDDEPLQRDLARTTLEPFYRVLEAESGRAALEVLGGAPVDLVLLDVGMPGLDGFETCREIKARHSSGARHRFLPVVLQTARSGEEERNKGLEAGADEFLAKPVERLELLDRLRPLLRLRRESTLLCMREENLRQREAALQATNVAASKQLEELQHLQVLKDDLISLIVHDLKNPLAGVMGFLELLQFQLSDPALVRARTNADRAADAARKLRDLLSEVVDVQRLEASGLPLNPERVPVGPLVREAAATLEGAAKSRNIRVEISVEGDPVASVDRGLVRRALENLVANAIRYSPSQDTVSVRVRPAEGRLLVEVSDRGPGIADTTKVRLFNKFAAVEAKQGGDRRRGFGLGLHFVKLVATAHGGSAFVRDHEGGGSIFGLAIPLGATGTPA